MTHQTPQTIGLNAGYGHTKLYTNRTAIIIPSIIGYPEQLRYQGDLIKNGAGLASQNNIRLKTPDGIRFIGQLALTQSRVKWSPKNRSRVESDTMKLLMLAALSEANINGQVNLVTGLPVKWYTDKNKLIQNLRGTHSLQRIGHKKQTILINDVAVLPEPFGAIYSQVLNSKGNLKNKKFLDIISAVVDIGMYTTDFILCDRMHYVESNSSSIETGMKTVYDLVAQAVEDRFGLSLDTAAAETAIRSGQIRVQGQPRKIAPLVAPILEAVAQEILSGMSDLWGDGKNIDILLVTGGGASPMGPYFSTAFPQLHIVDDSQIANAQGYYYYGLLKWRAS